jgi:hypothetical protein
MAVLVGSGARGWRKLPTERILQEIEAEIARLQAARAVLVGETNARTVGKPGTVPSFFDPPARCA